MRLAPGLEHDRHTHRVHVHLVTLVLLRVAIAPDGLAREFTDESGLLLRLAHRGIAAGFAPVEGALWNGPSPANRPSDESDLKVLTVNAIRNHGFLFVWSSHSVPREASASEGHGQHITRWCLRTHAQPGRLQPSRLTYRASDLTRKILRDEGIEQGSVLAASRVGLADWPSPNQGTEAG